MEFNDVLGLGKILPLDKLLDVLQKAVGRVTKSYYDRKDIETKVLEVKAIAEAKANEIKIIGEAISKNALFSNDVEYNNQIVTITSANDARISEAVPLADRAKDRIMFQEEKRQLNIEEIIGMTAEQLKNDPPITNEPIDDTWASRFFKIAEDISNEEMQALWAKILSGEIRSPNTYSLRTLEVIRNLSKREADIFKKIANYAISINGSYCLYKGTQGALTLNNFNYNDIMTLIEIGILHPGDFTVNEIKSVEQTRSLNIIIGNTLLVLTMVPGTGVITIPVNTFTTVGIELLNLIKIEPPIEYLQSFVKDCKRPGVTFEKTTIVSVTDGIINYDDPLQEFDGEF